MARGRWGAAALALLVLAASATAAHVRLALPARAHPLYSLPCPQPLQLRSVAPRRLLLDEQPQPAVPAVAEKKAAKLEIPEEARRAWPARASALWLEVDRPTDCTHRRL